MICKLFYRYFLFISLIFCVGWKGLNGITVKDAVYRFFDYFKQEDPRGIPALDLEDPLEMISPLEMVPVTLYNGKLFGISTIKIEHVFLNFLSLTGSMEVTSPRLEVNGHYKWPSLFSESSGAFNATVINATFACDFSMFVSKNYSLYFTDLELNETSDDVLFDFKNLVWEHQLILDSGVVDIFIHEIIDVFFKQIKSTVLEEINGEVSKFISSLPPVEFFLSPEEDSSSSSSSVFPENPKSNSGSQMESESLTFAPILHRFFLFIGMEPFYLPDKDTRAIGLNFKMEKAVLHGISRISKVEFLTIIYKDKKVYIEAEMTYPRLLLFYKIKMSSGKSINMDFYEKNQLNNVYTNVRVVIDLQLRQPPSVRYLDIHVGSFGKLRERKAKNFWSKIVGAFTDFRDLILREIVNALQGTIKKALQKKLNTTDVVNGLVFVLERLFINN